MHSSVVGFDESGCYCNKKLDWAWIAQIVYFAFLFMGKWTEWQRADGRLGDSFE